MPKLSKAQWLAGPRKSGTYAAYNKWYNHYVAPPVNPLAPMTSRQLQNQIAEQTAAVYDPQRKQLEQEAASRAATIQAASQAASALLAQHAPITQQAYSQAAGDVASIGAGYTGEMAAKVDAAQKAAQSFGQSQGVGTEAPTVDTAALHDASYYGGVGIPGSSLAAQGANWTALNANEAGIPLLQGAQDIRSSQQDYEKQLVELAQKRPELRQQVMDALYKNEISKVQLRIQQQAQETISSQFGEKVRHDVATEKASTRRNQISYQRMLNTHQDAISRAAASGQRPNASLSKAYGHIVDGNGHPILDGNGKMIPVAKSQSAASVKAKTQAQYGKAVGEAAKMFKDSQETTDTQFGITTTKPAKRKWQWGNAIRYIQNRYGIPKARARAALISAGFKPPKPGPGYIPGTKNRGPGGTGPK